jgi:hypothetical protein
MPQCRRGGGDAATASWPGLEPVEVMPCVERRTMFVGFATCPDDLNPGWAEIRAECRERNDLTTRSEPPRHQPWIVS